MNGICVNTNECYSRNPCRPVIEASFQSFHSMSHSNESLFEIFERNALTLKAVIDVYALKDFIVSMKIVRI